MDLFQEEQNMSTQDLISIVVPVYNTEAYLLRCIRSLQQQSYKHLEIILVDDGSKDSSLAICKREALSDPRIKVLHQENGGVASARNAGMRVMTGQWLLLIDGDDYIHPDMARDLLQAVKKNNAQTAICGFSHVFPVSSQTDHAFSSLDQMERAFSSPGQTEYAFSSLNQKNCTFSIPAQTGPVFQLEYAWNGSRHTFAEEMLLPLYRNLLLRTQSNKLYSTEIIRKHQLTYPKSFSINEDIWFCTRYLTYCERIACIPGSYLYYWQNSQGQSQISRFHPEGVESCFLLVSAMEEFLDAANASPKIRREMDNEMLFHICGFAGHSYYRTWKTNRECLEEIRQLAQRREMKELLARIQAKGLKNRVAKLLLGHGQCRIYHWLCLCLYGKQRKNVKQRFVSEQKNRTAKEQNLVTLKQKNKTAKEQNSAAPKPKNKTTKEQNSVTPRQKNKTAKEQNLTALKQKTKTTKKQNLIASKPKNEEPKEQNLNRNINQKINCQASHTPSHQSPLGGEEEIMVSISCVAYNHGAYIAQSLDSYLMQKTTFKFEILVYDDVSTDNTRKIIREYAEKYPDIIKPYFPEENQYSQGKYNVEGFFNYPRAKGKYTAMCDGDDYWTDEHKLQMQVDYMEAHPECAMCLHAARIETEEKAVQLLEIRPYKKSRIIPTEQVIDKMFNYPTASLLFRTAYTRDLQDYYYTSPVGDIPIQLHMAAKGTVYYIDRKMSVYRQGVTTSWSALMKEGNYKQNLIQHHNAMKVMYRAFSKETAGKYDAAIERACRRMDFLTLLNVKEYDKALLPGYRSFYRELPLRTRLLIRFELAAPGLFKAVRILVFGKERI